MKNGAYFRAMEDSDLAQFLSDIANDCVSCSDDGTKKMPCLQKHGVLWCDKNSVQAWLISEDNKLSENQNVSYEIYGIVDTREIFCGATEMPEIAYAIANNNLGTARYAKTLIYKVVKNDDVVVERSISDRFEI